MVCVCVAGIHGGCGLAKQETLTPPGHLVSPLVCRGPWMSTVVLYCWCHSDSASVLLYFTLYRMEKLLVRTFDKYRLMITQQYCGTVTLTTGKSFSIYALVLRDFKAWCFNSPYVFTTLHCILIFMLALINVKRVNYRLWFFADKSVNRPGRKRYSLKRNKVLSANSLQSCT